MSEFQRVAKLPELPDPGTVTLEIDDRFVLLVRSGDHVYCIDDVCTHDGGPLGEGRLDGLQICCPRHGARFDVTTGKPLTMPATEPTIAHEVRVEQDEVWVRLSE